MSSMLIPAPDQARPDFAAYANGWSRTRLVAITPIDDRLGAVARAIAKTHVNGGAEIAQFLIDADPAVAWYLSRDQVEVDFFRDFFAHEIVCERLRAARAVHSDSLGFSAVSPFEALGTLATIIERGGAYRSLQGEDRRIRKLANGFAGAAFEQRFSEVAVWFSGTSWSDWFFDVAWDNSFFWLDKRTGIATVLLTTDTD